MAMANIGVTGIKTFIILILLSVLTLAQTPTPASGYTPYAKLKKYPTGARGIADSLNWNYTTIDRMFAHNEGRDTLSGITFFGIQTPIYNRDTTWFTGLSFLSGTVLQLPRLDGLATDKVRRSFGFAMNDTTLIFYNYARDSYDTVMTRGRDFVSIIDSISQHRNLLNTHSTEISQTASDISLVASDVLALDGEVNANTDTLEIHRSELNLKADEISLSVLRTDMKDSVISFINISPEVIKISSDKINIYGIIKAFNGSDDSTVIDGNKLKTGTVIADSIRTSYAVFKALNGTGDSTVILGSKIKTGTITADRLNVDSLSAIHTNLGVITAGTINAGLVNVYNISATKISTGTLSADRIGSSSITASKLSVDSLNSISANLGTITAGNITGVTITGGTLRTAATGQRVELSGAGNNITFYNSSGTDCGSVSGAFLYGGALINISGQLTVADNIYAETNVYATEGEVYGDVVNSGTGFQIAGSATSGNYLRGNGTKFVSSAIQASDIPSHNQSASTITTGTLSIARGGTGGGISGTSGNSGEIITYINDGAGNEYLQLSGYTLSDKADAFSGYSGNVNWTDNNGALHECAYTNGVLTSYTYTP